MKNILVTGSNGMLGTDLCSLLRKENYNVIPTVTKIMDITNYDSVLSFINQIIKPDLIIHTAAYTNVDGAESDSKKCFLVNDTGSYNITLICKKFDIPMLYISTDYVFDGKKTEPYTEYDETNPLSIYGKSKCSGEKHVKKLDKYYIVRTSGLYGKHGKNFVHTMLNFAKQRKKLKVVGDQITSPTWTVNLSEAIIKLIKTHQYGIYHITSSGSCSWYDFACEIFRLKNIDIKIEKITVSEYPLPAPRPLYSVLSHKALNYLGIYMLSWREALKNYLSTYQDL